MTSKHSGMEMSANRAIVLVTGGSGLVGRCLQDEVAGRRERLRINEDDCHNDLEFVFLSSQDGDLTDYETALGLFVKYKPSYVVHLAAKVGGLYANLADKDAGLFYKLNSQLNKNVLKLSHYFKVKRCLSCLSTCIFPDQVELPLDETKIHLGPPHESNLGYALAKRQVDKLNREYNQVVTGGGDLQPPVFLSLIPTNIYGPHDNFSPSDSHVVPGLIHRAYRAAARGDKDANLAVYGSGRPLRQFIFAPDLAKLILWLLELDSPIVETYFRLGEPSIIMSPDEQDELSIGQVAEMIAQEFSVKFKLNMQVQCEARDRPDGQYRKTASNAKLCRLLAASDQGEFEFTPMREGLAQTIDWFCSQYPAGGVRGAE